MKGAQSTQAGKQNLNPGSAVLGLTGIPPETARKSLPWRKDLTLKMSDAFEPLFFSLNPPFISSTFSRAWERC